MKEAVRAVLMAGWSCTPHVKVIPVSKDCFIGRTNTLKRNTSWLPLSITWKHCGRLGGGESNNQSEDSRAPSAGCSERLLPGLTAGRVQW